MSLDLQTALKAVRRATETVHAPAPRTGIARLGAKPQGALLLHVLLDRLIREGELTVIDAAGGTHRFGRSGSAPRVTLRLRDHALHWKLVINSQLRFGEAYMDGTIALEEGSVRDLAEIAARNLIAGSLLPMRMPAWLRRAIRPLQQYNPVRRARTNAAHHYDRPDRLYELFLDADRQYSCAYYTHPGETLETAQQNKKRHIAAKLLLAPNIRVLDIGSGWGGLALHLAAQLVLT